MDSRYSTSKWMALGMLLLGLVTIPVFGNGYSIYQSDPVRTELAVLQHHNRTRSIAFCKVIHLILHKEYTIGKNIAAVYHHASRIFSRLSMLQVKTANDIDSSCRFLHCIFKIPSPADQDSDSH